MQSIGYTCGARGNVYNGENDFSQGFVWEVWQRPGSSRDWVHDDNAIVVFYVHTGADVRGGYGRPLITSAEDNEGESCLPLDWTIGYYTADDQSEEVAESHDLNPERWDQGYSGSPWHHMTDQLEAAGFTVGRCAQTRYGLVWVFMHENTGETIRVSPGYYP